MKISKNNRKNFKEKGFTLVELVVVIAGLAALGAFTIPAVLNSIKINKIEEAKALMTYAFANNVLESVELPILKKRINKLIAKKLGVNLGSDL